MSGSIPSWVTNIESDKTSYQKKLYFTSILNIVILIAFLYIATRFGDNLLLLISSAFIVSISLIFINDKTAAQKPNRPNLLAANLYRIGTELENFDSSSPSYIKRTQKYLKNCQQLLNDLKEHKSYFIEDYITFLNNIDNIITRINYFYLKKSEPIDHNVYSDLKELARFIHDNYNNLQSEHTSFVEGIRNNLPEVESQPLNTSTINKLVKSVNTGWHSLSDSHRTLITALFIFLTFFSVSSFVMYNTLGMEKTASYGYAFVGTSTLTGYLTDKIMSK
ncbi:MAG: hypothetical protein KAT05_12865 [Spirochaetes bacterium]|nr:hypothetical protein [Spirochaetota bacterium]